MRFVDDSYVAPDRLVDLLLFFYDSNMHAYLFIVFFPFSLGL